MRTLERFEVGDDAANAIDKRPARENGVCVCGEGGPCADISEVRRAALVAILLPSKTADNQMIVKTALDAVLSRARDVDAAVRRTLFKRLADVDAGYEYVHCEGRESLILNGLRDRYCAAALAPHDLHDFP